MRTVWRDVLATSYRALTDVVAGIGDDQWQLATPCSEWDVTQVIQHAAGDQLAFAEAFGIGIGATYNPFAPSGAIDGTAAELVRDAVEQTATAWATVTDETETVPTPLPRAAGPRRRGHVRLGRGCARLGYRDRDRTAVPVER